MHGLSTVSLRYGNVYGPRQDPLGEAGVIAIFCGKLLEGGRPTVFGDGLQTRDYDFVGDVVAANLAASGTDGAGPYNVGTGRETTVIELIEALRELGGGVEFEPEFQPERAGEVRRIAIDPSRAREELGWEARTELIDGLRITLDSLR
jgi:UDP-glucose 4-epimerase